MNTSDMQARARELFTDKDLFDRMIYCGISSLTRELQIPDDTARRMFAIYIGHSNSIFAQAESPIEKSLWAGALLRSLASGWWLEFWRAPSGNFFSEKESRCEFLAKSCASHLIYQAEKREGESFLEFAREREPDKSADWIKDVDDAATLYLGMSLLFAPKVVLQPNISVGPRRFRPDAIAFVPAFPDKCLIIECDGFEYHSSEKSFTSDRERDRIFSSELGIEVRRYSGQEIYHKPLDVADDVVAHLRKKLGTPSALARKWKAAQRVWIKRQGRRAANAT